MLSLPYDFDTTETWVKVLKLFFIIVSIYAATVIGLLLRSQFVAAIVLVLFGLAFWPMLRRVRTNIGMGARGRLSATEVITYPVQVWRYSLDVPVGQFSIDQFREVTVVERVIVSRPDRLTGTDNVGSVRLVGKENVREIEIMVATIEAANAFAREVSATLQLPLRALAASGTTIVEVTL